MSINRQLQNEGARGSSAAQDRAPPPGTRHFSAADNMKVGLVEMRGLERELQIKQKALALLVERRQRIAEAEKELNLRSKRKGGVEPKLSNVAIEPVPEQLNSPIVTKALVSTIILRILRTRTLLLKVLL
jgi:hypothetical protein